MSQLAFSDDDDVSKHEAKLEQIHKALVCEKSHRALTDDSKENQASLFHLDEDPVCLRILRERQGPIQNVFAKPFASPTKHGDVFEFDSSECKHSSDLESRPLSANSEYSSSSSSRPCSALSASHTPSLSRRRRQRLQKLREAIIAYRTGAGEDDVEFVPPLSVMESEEAENTPKMELRPRKELWNTDDDLPLADIQLQVVLEESKKDAQSHACSGSKSSQANVSERCDDDDFAFLPSAGLRTPKSKSKRTLLGNSNSVPSYKRKRKCQSALRVNKDRHLSDTDEDLPLSHFMAPSSGTPGQNGSRSMSRKRKVSNSGDDEYKASYTDAPLSEIRRRYRSMRRRDGLKQRKIDYSDMDWDD